MLRGALRAAYRSIDAAGIFAQAAFVCGHERVEEREVGKLPSCQVNPLAVLPKVSLTTEAEEQQIERVKPDMEVDRDISDYRVELRIVTVQASSELTSLRKEVV